MNRDPRGNDRTRETRVNERIRAREVRLIDENGEMIGVMPTPRALEIARERDLDLVEVQPNAVPPVCKLMDYGRYKYEQAKKESEARKHQKTITLKEIRLRPRTDEHDIGVKTRKIQEFLADGDKVRVSVQFRGPDLRHPEIGRRLLDNIAETLKGTAVIERPPIMEGRVMSMIVSRAPGWEPPKKQAPTPSGKRQVATAGAVAGSQAPTSPSAPAAGSQEVGDATDRQQ
ncbi:MAG: translation initiation factor IF-3 [Thermogemmatispora sp.]|uniref:translation initiation factor IF-3 n=1 Tax=Thermogemmatispora sp. TaxID=1968838 RepID=UPI0026200C1F|nr:translation initiation factor IF-3 [Thermogemmatispora sp.]MBX5456015.1 translation initiation factor IF-3 [Thermogemmatispora sp.]